MGSRLDVLMAVSISIHAMIQRYVYVIYLIGLEADTFHSRNMYTSCRTIYMTVLSWTLSSIHTSVGLLVSEVIPANHTLKLYNSWPPMMVSTQCNP